MASFLKNTRAQLEPVAVINSGIGLIEALIALAIGFGLDITTEQAALLMTMVITLGNFLQTMLVRAQVTPIANARNSEGVRSQLSKSKYVKPLDYSQMVSINRKAV